MSNPKNFGRTEPYENLHRTKGQSAVTRIFTPDIVGGLGISDTL